MDLETYNKFAEVAELNNINYEGRRTDDLHFVECEIVSCGNPLFWYYNFIGVRFIGVVTYDTYVMKLYNDDIIRIREVRPVKVTGNTRITIGRSISAENLKII